MRAWLSCSAVVLVLAGCGGKSADLFEVQRSGADRNANVDLVVNDGGTAACDRARPKALSGQQLLTARDLARGLEQQASLSIALPKGPGSTLRYVVRTPSGRVSFYDTSEHRPHVFDRLVAFSKDVIEGLCGIER